MTRSNTENYLPSLFAMVPKNGSGSLRTAKSRERFGWKTDQEEEALLKHYFAVTEPIALPAR